VFIQSRIPNLRMIPAGPGILVHGVSDALSPHTRGPYYQSVMLGLRKRQKCQYIPSVLCLCGSTMTSANHYDQVGEIYPTKLNELNCPFVVSFAVAVIVVAVMVYRLVFVSLFFS